MPSVSALVLLYDIRGFTAATRKMDPARIGAFATAAHEVILAQFRSPPPTFVKNLGDGHLLLWETGLDPDPALLSAAVAGAASARTAFAAFVAGQEATGEALPKHVGIGVAFGVVSKTDDYYGVALNLAARLQNIARPEGLAMDGNVFDVVTRADERLKSGFDRAKVRLKGLGSTTVYVRRPFSWERLLARVGRWAVVAAAVLGYVALADAGLAVPGGAAMRRWIDGHDASLLRKPRSAAEVARSADAQRRDLAALLARARTAAGWFTSDVARETEKDGVDVWSSSQTACAVLGTPHLSDDDLRPVLDGLAATFRPPVFVADDAGAPYGWRAHPGLAYTEAEPLLWTIAALARALGREGLVPAARRDEFLGYLRTAQEAARLHHPPESTGGWNMFPHQGDPKGHSPYTTTLALQALLELREAGLPWEGSEERRDELLRSTAAWFARTFVPTGPTPGWRRTQDPLEVVSKGLTFQVLSLLLRAEARAGIAVPEPILDAATALVASHDGVSLGSSSADAGEFAVPFEIRAPAPASPSKPVPSTGKEGINFLWHPWAIATARLWLARAERVPAATLDHVRVRRALGWLVVDQRDEAWREVSKGYTFMASETLYGLCHVPPP